ncbi:hypothetical protein DFJ74DRAFT_685055 [Hyaloraphidium curvatum]|nr:hypothetical protein DFJ74DRAFT_685055 [Hyaloraphidium curvatum]
MAQEEFDLYADFGGDDYDLYGDTEFGGSSAAGPSSTAAADPPPKEQAAPSTGAADSAEKKEERKEPPPVEGAQRIQTLEEVQYASGGDAGGPEETNQAKIFVGGLSWETSEDGMRDHFAQWGPVRECIIMRDPATGQSRGFGFVIFESAETITEALKVEHWLDGKLVDAKRATTKPSAERTEKIFVGGVHPEVTEDEFQEYFGQFGKVVEALLMYDRETGRARGFGFITFDNADVVDIVLEQQGHLFFRGKPVEVKRAVPRHKAPPPTASFPRRNVPPAGAAPAAVPSYSGAYPDPGYVDTRASYAGPIRQARPPPQAYGYGPRPYGYGPRPYGAGPPPRYYPGPYGPPRPYYPEYGFAGGYGPGGVYYPGGGAAPPRPVPGGPGWGSPPGPQRGGASPPAPTTPPHNTGGGQGRNNHGYHPYSRP